MGDFVGQGKTAVKRQENPNVPGGRPLRQSVRFGRYRTRFGGHERAVMSSSDGRRAVQLLTMMLHPSETVELRRSADPGTSAIDACRPSALVGQNELIA